MFGWWTICVNKQFNIFLSANEKTSHSHNACIASHLMQADNLKNKQTTTSIYEGILSWKPALQNVTVEQTWFSAWVRTGVEGGLHPCGCLFQLSCIVQISHVINVTITFSHGNNALFYVGIRDAWNVSVFNTHTWPYVNHMSVPAYIILQILSLKILSYFPRCYQLLLKYIQINTIQKILHFSC